MSLLEIIQLVGYSLGAALPLWLSALLARQRRGLRPQERVLLALAVVIGLWNLSNLLLVLRALLGFDAAHWVWLLRTADTLAVVSITLAYSLLLHVHLHLWANAHARPLTRFERVRVYLSYIPAVFLISAVPRLWLGTYAPMLVQLSFFVVPFGLWATYVLGLIAVTDLLIARKTTTTGERRLMLTLAASFICIAILLLAAYAFGAGRGTLLGSYLQTLGNLGSLLPTALIAYHVYRYRYLELIIKESLVAASFAAVILVVYLYGIRTVETWLTGRYGLRAGVVEALLILAFALSAAPLRAWLEQRFQRLFAREAALYREVVTRIGAQAHNYQQLPELLRFIEARTARELGLRRVCCYLPTEAQKVAPAAAVGPGASAAAPASDSLSWAANVLAQVRADGDGPTNPLEAAPELRAHGFELAYALGREGTVYGLLLVDAAHDTLTPEVRAVLAVLAGQLAVAVADARLFEENVRLERRLAQGERLAALGQMAATVAHEVKNPLSAIKSIAQVMREDERLADEYARDLELIVGETDRLSRSVTQLLSFARQTPPAATPTSADELTRTLAELFRAEAHAKALTLECRTGTAQVTLNGAQAAAVRAALSNLLLNALQTTPAGGRVLLETGSGADGLYFAVADSGPGVPVELHARIWEPFFTTRQRGTGLGLAIVQKRMCDVGGRAQLVPTPPGTGARFELHLPSACVAADLQSAVGQG